MKIYLKFLDLLCSLVYCSSYKMVLNNEKFNFNKTRWFLNCKDWIRFKITNDISNDFTEVVVSPGDAKKIDRSNKIFKFFNINKEITKKFQKY